mgnify:CR=1 FL=1
MTKSIKMWLLGIFSLCFLLPVKALQPQDSIRFNLLTCAPGSEIYALFGHTALRYQNFSDQTDLVFNYGMFSFNTPHFVFRFVKGETDYQLGITPYPYFESEYALRGSSVYEQELNLTPAEKWKLLSLLEENYRPENRVYRYNYFYDNCTTRARDQIERSIDGTVVYPEGILSINILKDTNGMNWALIFVWERKPISRLTAGFRCLHRFICATLLHRHTSCSRMAVAAPWL